jgi:GNAT superfamily N-acetyltransferase
MVYEWQQGGYVVSTDKQRIDLNAVHDFLANRSYWAKGRTLDIIRRSIDNSIVFGLYAQDAAGADRQVGFARVVTDYATFAWLCDVFVSETSRGNGLGKWLIQCVVAHPELQNLRLWLLATRDAHGLYAKYGFKVVEEPGRWMTRREVAAVSP